MTHDPQPTAQVRALLVRCKGRMIDRWFDERALFGPAWKGRCSICGEPMEQGYLTSCAYRARLAGRLANWPNDRGRVHV